MWWTTTPKSGAAQSIGVKILGGIARLGEIAVAKRADEILICIPSALPDQMRTILAACRAAEFPCAPFPRISELMDGKVSRRDLRSPQIEDLLQREPIRSRLVKKRATWWATRSCLVTGAGGSIGSELCRQIAEAGPRKLFCLINPRIVSSNSTSKSPKRMDAAHVKPLLVDLLIAIA